MNGAHKKNMTSSLRLYNLNDSSIKLQEKNKLEPPPLAVGKQVTG